MKKCRWILIIALVVISLILLVACNIKMSQVIKPLSVKDVFALQLSFSKERFVHIIKQWQDSHMLENFVSHFKYDFLYLIGYSLFITGMFIILGCLIDNPNLKSWALLPISAGILDAIENTLELSIITRYSFNATLIFLQSVAAVLKFLFIAVSIVVIVWIVAGYIRRNV